MRFSFSLLSIFFTFVCLLFIYKQETLKFHEKQSFRNLLQCLFHRCQKLVEVLVVHFFLIKGKLFISCIKSLYMIYKYKKYLFNIPEQSNRLQPVFCIVVICDIDLC